MAADFNKKRKDISPKKETFGKKKDRREVMVLSDDEDEVSVAKGGSCVRKLLQSQQSDDENLIEESTTAAVKNEESDYENYLQESTTTALKIEESDGENYQRELLDFKYYNGNHNLPMIHQKSPGVNEIFEICYAAEIPPERIVKQKPLRVKKTATFVVDQTTIGLRHPYDLDADDNAGTFLKKDSYRFYEVFMNGDGSLCVSTEVHVNQNSNGEVISGVINRRSSSGWKKVDADISRVFAVIRRRATHQKTLREHGYGFKRCTTFVMHVNEINSMYGKLKDLKTYKLVYPHIIQHYYFDGPEVEVESDVHGNARGENATEFRPREHSLKKEIQETMTTEKRAPRLIAQNFTEESDIFESSSDASVVRDVKQVKNYR